MKNQTASIRSLFAILFSAALVFALATAAAAQRRFDPRAAGTEAELKGVAQFAQDLVNFVKQAQALEANPNASEAEHKKLQDFGRRIKDGTSNTRANLQGFIAKLKNSNRWNDQFDAEFLDAITSPRLKAFIQRIGGARKALTEAEAAINSLSQDVDTTISDAKRRAANDAGSEPFFMNASFAGNRAGKVRLKCVLLGVGVAAAEVTRLKLTAENLDNLFDSNKCGGAGAPTT